MSEGALEKLVDELRDPVVMLPLVTSVMDFIIDAREQYITTMAAEFRGERHRVAAFRSDVVRDPEVAAWLRWGGVCALAAPGSVHLLRTIQLGPSELGMLRWGEADSELMEIDHEDERRFTREEAPFRTASGADFFFESAAELPMPAQSAPQITQAPTMQPPPPCALRSSEQWAACHSSAQAQAARGGTAIITNWWGHYGVYLPVMLAAIGSQAAGAANNPAPVLLVLNSIDTEDESMHAFEVMSRCFGADSNELSPPPQRPSQPQKRVTWDEAALREHRQCAGLLYGTQKVCLCRDR
jgi:hypothetical protein